MAAATTAAPAAPSGAAAPAAQAQAASAPFRAGTFATTYADGYTQTVTLGAAQIPLTPYTPSPNAYLTEVAIQAVCVAGSNVATVAFNGDGPWCALASVTFQDANQKPIVGPLTGYQLMVVNKFGGYANMGDPRASAIYSAVTGSGGTAGSFTFVLRVPLQIASRDAMGSLQNKSSSSSFQLNMTVATEGTIYSTSPTDAPTLTITCFERGYVQPNPADSVGSPLAQSPPQLGTTQYWTTGTYNSLNGSQQIQVNQGLGYPIRNMAFVNYDVSAGTRAAGDTDWPTTFGLLWKGTFVVNGYSKTLWKNDMSQLFGYNNATADAALGLENGVYILPFDNDFSNAPGDDLRNAYLPTQQGDLMQLQATWNGNSNLYYVCNYVAPAAGPNNVASIRAGR
jgi:hypothetical protein